MTPRSILRMLRQRWPWLLLGPVVAAALVLFATRNALDTYASESVLYTGLVSGYTIESSANDRVDYLTVANAFDNLVNLVKARTTVEEAALRLLARQLVTEPERLRVFDSERAPHILHLIDGSRSEARVLERLRAAKHRPESEVYALLFTGSTPFAVDEIQKKLAVSRVGASDLIKMRYTSIDPQLCQWTLEVLLEVVTARHQSMKTRETGNVVAFFEREVDRAEDELADRVEALRAFGVDNRVINYNEQTKAIAGQKEAIAAELQQERQRQAAAEAVVQELEARMVQQQALAVQSDTMLALRDQLTEATTAVALAEAGGTPRPDLRRRADSLETELTRQAGALYDLSNSREGLNRENVADTWLQKLLDATDARVQVVLLEQRLQEYGRYYDEFSPLGATLTTLEREVSTAEQTYLELLNSLNMARMREQNIQMASRLDVVDAPFFPEEPEGSNRLILAVGAMVGCFGLLATLFVLIELFHPTIRSVERARAITKLEVATAYPPIQVAAPRLLARLWHRLAGRTLHDDEGPVFNDEGTAQTPRPRLGWQRLLRKTDPLETTLAASSEPVARRTPDDDLHDVLRVLDLHLIRAVKLHLLDRARPASRQDEPLRLAVVGALPEDGVALIATRLAMMLRDDHERVHHVALTTRTACDQDPVSEDLLGPGFATDVTRSVVSDLQTYEGNWSQPASPGRPTGLERTPAEGTNPDDGIWDRRLRREAEEAEPRVRAADPVPRKRTAAPAVEVSEADVVVVELPPMVEHAAPLQVVRDADLALMVLRADRTWTDADQHALKALRAAHPHPVLLVLTETNRDFLNGLTARGLPIPPFLRPIFG
ncbi:MAG: hypothetical protein AAGF99_11495 [Bacteroidota bacterium]